MIIILCKLLSDKIVKIDHMVDMEWKSTYDLNKIQ